MRPGDRGRRRVHHRRIDPEGQRNGAEEAGYHVVATFCVVDREEGGAETTLPQVSAVLAFHCQGSTGSQCIASASVLRGALQSSPFFGAVSLRLSQRLDANESIPYFIQDGSGVPGFVPSDRQLAVWALDAWSRESNGKLKFVEAKTAESALIRLRWIAANEGLFGETQRVRVGSREGALAFVMPAGVATGVIRWPARP